MAAQGILADGAARPPCAIDSAERQEALGATASRVRSWLLIEQPGAWGRDAVLESKLDRTVASAIVARCRALGVRPLLIRRPGWRRPVGRRRCYLAHSGPRRSWLEELLLDDVAELLALDWSAFTSGRAPGAGAAHAGPLYLVCTNGRHDRCCADLGRPLARALADAGVGDVWECSHIGGDRFAANLVCLPEGVYFGRVGADEGAAVAADYAGGLLTLDRYRGRSCYPPLVQAAELFARRAGDVRAIDGLIATAVAVRGADVADVTLESPSGGGWRVRVSRERSSRAVALTCRSEGSARPWEYHLVDLAQVPA